MMQRNRKMTRHRAGWTLIEMSVMISLLSAFSVVGISLITTLMALDTSLAGAAAFELNAGRLEDQLRMDAAHRALVSEVEGGIDLLDQTDSVIEYRIVGNTIHRTQKHERRVSRDTFRFLDSKIQLELEGNLLHLSILKQVPIESLSKTSQLENSDRSSLHVLIEVGRSNRFKLPAAKAVTALGGDS